jgi:DNA-binding LacI/PurR family transcriptional regulator
LLLLDKKVEGFNGHFAAVYQNFEKNLFTALKIMGERLLKYEKIILVCPFLNPFPKGIIRGFQQFCKEYNKSGVLMDNISNEAIIKHAAYIVLTDDGLVSLIKKIREAKLKIGEEVGILSYNKHPFKEIIFEGITTISTDFEQMGAMVAQLVVENKQQQVEVPFQLCIRQSL